MAFFKRFLPLLPLILSGFPLWGTMVVPMTLSQMTRQADRIFMGRCLDLSTELDERDFPSTYIRFEVLQGFKGVKKGETILIKLYGTERMPLHLLEGERTIVPLKALSLSPVDYRENAEYLLFLYPDSSLGFTSPVGAGQGRFEAPFETIIKKIEELLSHE